MDLDHLEAARLAPRESRRLERATDAEPARRRVHPEVRRPEDAMRLPAEPLAFLDDEHAADDALELRDEDDAAGDLPRADLGDHAEEESLLLLVEDGVDHAFRVGHVGEHPADGAHVGGGRDTDHMPVPPISSSQRAPVPTPAAGVMMWTSGELVSKVML